MRSCGGIRTWLGGIVGLLLRGRTVRTVRLIGAVRERRDRGISRRMGVR